MDNEPEISVDDFDEQFCLVLSAAEENIWRANIAIDRALLQNVQRDSMPQIPVWRLHLGATSTFLGLIQCLKTRYSSLGAFSLLRGLIEAWTHLYFISDESEAGTPALRAIRFEAGVMSEWASVDKQLDPETNYQATMKKYDVRIRELWQANGGANQPKRRTYNQVGQTLERMKRSQALRHVEILHSSSSTAVHMSAADFLLESSATSVTVVWATPGRRSAWLQFAIMCFDYLTISALMSVPSPLADGFIDELHERWQQIYNDPLLMSAVGVEGEANGESQGFSEGAGT